MKELIESLNHFNVYLHKKEDKKENSIARQILEIRFNNPELKNAFGEKMQEETEDILNIINKIAPRVIIYQGEGEVFSAGGDLSFLKYLTTLKQEVTQRMMYKFYRDFLRLAQYPCPTIAIINGHAVGAGFCFALGCDMIYANEEAKVGMNFTSIGIPPGMGGEYWVKKKLSHYKGSEMIYGAQIKKVKDWGLDNYFNFIGNLEQVRENALATAFQIALNSPFAIQNSLDHLRDFPLNLHRTLELESMGQSNCFAFSKVSNAIDALKNKEKFYF